MRCWGVRSRACRVRPIILRCRRDASRARHASRRALEKNVASAAWGETNAEGWSHQPESVDVDDNLGARNLSLRRVGQHRAQCGVQLFAAGRLQDEVIAVVALEAHDGRCRGAEDAHTFVARRFEPLAEQAGPLEGIVKLVAADEDVGKRRVGRVVHPTAKLELLFIEADEVVAGGELDRVMILKVSLQNHFTGGLSASGTSGDLGEELEGAFCSAEVGKSKSDIGSDDADERHAMNVVTLGDHLRSDEKIEFAFVQAAERALEIFVPADGVTIVASDARLWKHAVQQLFELF